MSDEKQIENILQLDHLAAKTFFLKHEHYCSIEIPTYFDFTNLLNQLSKQVERKKDIINFYKKDNANKRIEPKDINNINHKIKINKSITSYRTLTIIHPLMYVYLVYIITQKDNWELIKNKMQEKIDCVKNNILCESLPIINNDNKLIDKAVQITHWWKKIEQESLTLALSYEYMIHADIANYYPSIYTHSIPWAIHGKETAKNQKEDKNLLGNKIDMLLRSISYGQTNGIPQGSTLMDFIAEILLSEIDKLLFEKIESKKIDYKILRYRDDYRIFTLNRNDAEIILKLLSEVLEDFNLNLNDKKTVSSDDIITSSIRDIKLFFIKHNINQFNNIQNKLMLVKMASKIYENKGYLSKILNKINEKINSDTENPEILISIITDIAINNPKTYPTSSAIISKLLSLIKCKDKKRIIFDNINKKVKNHKKTSILELWLQRIAISIEGIAKINFDEKLCNILNKENNISTDLFCMNFIGCQETLTIFNTTSIINNDDLNERKNKEIIEKSEFDLFHYNNTY